MAIQDDVRKFVLEINESKNNGETLSNLTRLQKETNKLREENTQLEKVMAHLASRGKKNSETYKEMEAQLKKNKSIIAQNSVEMKGLSKNLDLAYMSSGQLKKRAMELRSALSASSEAADPEGYARLANELERVYVQMNKVKGNTDQTRGFLSNLKGVAGGLLPAFSFAAIIAGLTRIFSLFAQFDDKLADVMKTTGLTRKEVYQLNRELQDLDTRSSQEELLGLVRIGGKLGIEGKDNLLAFASAADKINVALNEDLGGDVEETINKLGRLVNIFKLNEKYSMEESLLKVGSVINYLGATSTANEGYLVDFAEKLAGFAPNAKISAPDVLGLASTFDQLGQEIEVSTTVIGNLLVKIGKDIPTYAAIAGMSIEDFSKLLNDDANEAMIQVLTSAKSTTGGLEGMAQTLETLGVDGQRASSILGALTANTDLLRAEQAKANQEFETGNSILDEFNTKNTTVQATLDKIGKWFKNIYLNILNSVNENLRSTTTKFLDQVQEVKNLQQELLPLIIEYEDLQAKSDLSADEQERMKILISDIAKLAPFAITQIDEYGNAIGISADKAREFIKAQQAMLKVQNTEQIKTQEKDLEKINKKLDKQVALKKHLVYSAQQTYGIRVPVGYYDERIAKTQKEIDKLNELKAGTEAYIKSLKGESLIDFNESGGNDKSTAIGTKKTVGTTVFEWDGNNWKEIDQLADRATLDDKAFKKAKEALTSSFNDEMALLKTQLDEKKITKEEYKNEEFALEMAHLISMRELYRQHNEGLGEINNEIAQKKLEWSQHFEDILKASKEVSEKLIEEDQKMFQDIDADMDKYLDNYLDNLEKETQATIEHEEKKREEIKKSKEAAIESSVQQGMAAVENAKNMKEAVSGILNAVRNELKALLAKFIATAMIKTMESSGKVAGPFALILAAAAGASAAALFNAIIPKFYSGGPTGTGGKYEPRGIVHAGEYVIPQEGVQNPTLRPFLDILEIARRSGTLRSLDMRPAAAMIAHPVQMFATGGQVDSVSLTKPEQIPIPSPNTDLELKKAIDRLNANLEKGIKASVNAFGRGSVDEANQVIDRFYNNVRRK